MTDLKQTQPAAMRLPTSPKRRRRTPTAQPWPLRRPNRKAASADKAKYDFVFQAVAYKSKDSADKLRERMEGEGLRTRMTIEKNNKGRPKWFRVQVLVRGTDADASAAKQVLVKMGLKDGNTGFEKACSGAVSEWISCLVFLLFRVLSSCVG